MSGKPREIHVEVTFKGMDASDAVRQYAVEKVTNSMQKYVHHDTKTHIVLRVEKERHSAEISFHADGQDFHAKEETMQMYSSIDALVNTIAQQLRKNKERITAHHR